MPTPDPDDLIAESLAQHFKTLVQALTAAGVEPARAVQHLQRQVDNWTDQLVAEHPEAMPHLVAEPRNNRGFEGLPRLHGSYGEDVLVYESSGAIEPQLWLQVEEPDVHASAHLPVSTALQVADQLRWLARHHYQLEADRA